MESLFVIRNSFFNGARGSAFTLNGQSSASGSSKRSTGAAAGAGQNYGAGNSGTRGPGNTSNGVNGTGSSGRLRTNSLKRPAQLLPVAAKEIGTFRIGADGDHKMSTEGASTFSGGRYTKYKLEQDIVLYRVGDFKNGLGEFLKVCVGEACYQHGVFLGGTQ